MDDENQRFEADLTSVKIDVAVIRSNYMRREEGEMLKASVEEVKTKVEGLEGAVADIKTSIEALRAEMYRVIAMQTWKLVGICVLIAGAINVASRYH